MIRKSTNELSIKPKMAPGLRTAMIAGIIVLLAVALYVSYQFGVKSGHNQYDRDRQMIGQLNNSITELRGQLAESEENLIIAQRHQQIQEEAYKQISTAYAGSEQKNRYLGSRLDFYRSIISPEDGQSGPAIQSLEASNQEGNVSFNVTLVQAIKHKHQVRGALRVQLFQGEEMIGQWPENSTRSINFQYFQQISGVIDGVQLSENAKMKAELVLQDGQEIVRWFDVPPSAQG